MLRIVLIISALLLCLSGCAPVAPSTIQISDSKIRAAFSQAATGAAYMTITNHTDTDDRLMSVSSITYIARDIQIHTMLMQEDMMVMQQVTEGVALPAGSEVVFAPGGYHIMFMGLQTELDEGKHIALTLNFANSPAQTVNFPVVAMHTNGMSH
ncbi:MAG: copper chaperone PCu(A)C [Glaciecola sp.]|jgi:copper(I)-binding protein|nr:copper chaperone PCu(A)C [Glaciecola sp.]MDG1815235.1 copper chaperone PCu(A)C [Glaciecola sp.]MDG2099301.1 copper chaperone PCu(A)C [Glaciecola sp.]